MRNLFYLLAIAAIGSLASCINDKTEDYSEWKEQNDDYVLNLMNQKDPDGSTTYTRLAPAWAPEAFCLVKWENDRSLTAKNLVPMSNSLVNVKYELELIDGTKVNDSYSSTTYGDSIYQCRPNQNIIGFWNCVTNMHVGDSVTCVIPAVAGYGELKQNNIKPYSTLIYRIKLVSIPSYELPI